MPQKSKRQIRIEPKAAESSAGERNPVGFDPDYAPVVKDLRRIGILASSFIAILVILAIFLR